MLKRCLRYPFCKKKRVLGAGNVAAGASFYENIVGVASFVGKKNIFLIHIFFVKLMSMIWCLKHFFELVKLIFGLFSYKYLKGAISQIAKFADHLIRFRGPL